MSIEREEVIARPTVTAAGIEAAITVGGVESLEVVPLLYLFPLEQGRLD